MFGIYTQFGLSSNYSYIKNCTIPYFINLISDRANVTVSGPTSFVMLQCKHDYKDKSANY